MVSELRPRTLQARCRWPGCPAAAQWRSPDGVPFCSEHAARMIEAEADGPILVVAIALAVEDARTGPDGPS